MAEEKLQKKENKTPERKSSAKIKNLVSQFNELTKQEKIEFLTRSGVWHLRFKNELIRPPLEMRKIIQRLSKLMFTCDKVFELAHPQIRKLNLHRSPTLAQLTSEDEIYEKVVQPILKIIDDHISAINAEITANINNQKEKAKTENKKEDKADEQTKSD